MLKRVYIETTIPSYYYNQRSEPEMVAMMHWTRDWWDHHRLAYDLVTSAVTLQELSRGDHPLQAEKIALLRNVPLLPVTDEVEGIVAVYLARKVMPSKPITDALHLALASCHACDILLTWNCLHLANANKIVHIHHVNALLGLKAPVLATPNQLMEEDHESDERGN
ncbi:MAG: type II toxin-antitoxin system VapC family toxin [Verrucomicrobia bacterium]|nr:type II toxin-antitoxin system VapC family toxin [Verrucomicrobiota bacterium]